MLVSSGGSWETRGGAWRKIAVDLDTLDLLHLVAEGKVEGYTLKDPAETREDIVDDAGVPLPTVQAYKVLQRQADRIIIVQMAKAQAITMDEAKKRLAAL